MKKFYLFIVMVITVMSITSCSSTRKATKQIGEVVGTEVVITMPLKTNNISDTKDMYRAVSNGTSSDWNMAKSIATTNARAELAIKIESVIRSAVESYTKQQAANATDNIVERDMGQTIQSYTLLTAKQTLINVNELESVTTRNNKNLEYTHWVALEISKDALIDEMVRQFGKIPANTKQNIDFNRDQFRGYLEEYLK